MMEGRGSVHTYIHEVDQIGGGSYTTYTNIWERMYVMQPEQLLALAPALAKIL